MCNLCNVSIGPQAILEMTRAMFNRAGNLEPVERQVYAFMPTEPNAVVVPIHKKAMPVIQTETDEIEAWLSAPWDEAKALQRPLDNERRMVLPHEQKAV